MASQKKKKKEDSTKPLPMKPFRQLNEPPKIQKFAFQFHVQPIRNVPTRTRPAEDKDHIKNNEIHYKTKISNKKNRIVGGVGGWFHYKYKKTTY